MILILLITINQITQTIYIPTITDITHNLNIHKKTIQNIINTYLLTYNISQLFYNPISNHINHRPIILIEISIFILTTLITITTSNLTILITTNTIQKINTNINNIITHTLPQNLYKQTQLHHTNNLLNIKILINPLLTPLIDNLLNTI